MYCITSLYVVPLISIKMLFSVTDSRSFMWAKIPPSTSMEDKYVFVV